MIRTVAAAVPLTIAGLLVVAAASAQTRNPFPDPIEAEQGVIVVDYVEFASLPNVDGEPARMMTLVHEPGTGRIFVSDMRGPIYAVSPDGTSVTEYLNVDDPRWGVDVESSGRERGVQSFAFHPASAPGTPGFGKLYVWTDTADTDPSADFRPSGGDEVSHHTVLLEFTAADPAADAYDGGPPRVLARFAQPFGNHNGGEITFDPLAAPGDPDYGHLFVGVADGGSGGDPFDMAQDLGSAFGKILRIDPLGSDGPTGEYGIPRLNPFAGDGDPGTLGEIWAYGVRNPQHLAWDSKTGRMFVADIGQNAVEAVSPVTPGANLGWNLWEGSFRFVDRSGVVLEDPRSDPDVTYPVAEYDREDPLMIGRAAVTGLLVYRSEAIPALSGRLLFGDLPSGEIFHVDADDLPDGGQDAIRRVLLNDGGEAKTFLELIRERNAEQGREAAGRADLRLGSGPDGRVFLLNKHDGTLRELVHDSDRDR